MKRKILTVGMRVILLVVICGVAQTGYCLKATTVEKADKTDKDEPQMTLNTILEKVESSYPAAGFSANFTQMSTLKAMQITDNASGQALFKRPGMMRWEYEKPERQQIITDGKNLWVYRPDDKQVSVGSFPAFFGDGKGASFLSNISLLRQKFHIILMGRNDAGDYLLHLKPMESNPDIAQIQLTVSKKTFFVYQVVTLNSYGDETRIELTQIEPKDTLDNELFIFKIPENTDVIQLNE